MKKYKVEITQTFCFNVLADYEEQAKDRAEISLMELQKIDQQHNNLIGDTVFMVYDITDTDDSFCE